jgi:YnbE-like lipoprotein
LKDRNSPRLGRCLAPATLVLVLAGCQPTVKVEAPDKPITINLNVKIEQEVRIKVEKDADKLLDEKKDLF